MRIYKENGKVIAELNESMEICDSNVDDTLQTYKEALLERISRRFDYITTEAALKSMKESKQKK